jgi:hypothetical protein
MLELRRNDEYTAARVNFRGVGFTGTATSNSTTNIDYKLTEDRLVYGGQLILKNQVFGDYVAFSVVDKDNILGYGAGVVLGTYLSSWNVSDDSAVQPALIIDYPTKVLANLYLRIAYTSVGSTAVNVAVNVYCVKNIT